MEGDVTYADLRFPLSEGGRRPTQAEPTADTKKEQCPENSAGPRSSLWVRATILLGILCLLLLSACIALGILVLQSEKTPEAEAGDGTARQTQESEKFQEIQDVLNRTQEDLDRTAADLKNATEELQRWRSQAGLQWFCPSGWILRNERCFYVSETHSQWARSLLDCIARDAKLTSRSSAELMYLTVNRGTFWIGAIFQNNKFILSNETNFRTIRYRAEEPYLNVCTHGSYCGALALDNTVRELQLYRCEFQLKWICEKDAIRLEYEVDSKSPALSTHGVKYVNHPVRTDYS